MAYNLLNILGFTGIRLLFNFVFMLNSIYCAIQDMRYIAPNIKEE